MVDIFCSCLDQTHSSLDRFYYIINIHDLLKIEDEMDKYKEDFRGMMYYFGEEQQRVLKCLECKRLYVDDPESNFKLSYGYEIEDTEIYSYSFFPMNLHNKEEITMQLKAIGDEIELFHTSSTTPKTIVRTIEHKKKNTRCILVKADLSMKQMEKVARMVASKPNCAGLLLLFKFGRGIYAVACPDPNLVHLPQAVARRISPQPVKYYPCRCGNLFSTGFAGPNDFYTITFNSLFEVATPAGKGPTSGDSVNTFFANNAHLTYRCPECRRLYIYDTKDGKEMLYVYKVYGVMTDEDDA